MAGTGFAGGLAEGFNNAMQLGMQQRQYNSLNDHRERQDELRQQLAEAKLSGNTGTNTGSGAKGEDTEGFDNALRPIFQAGNKPTAQPQAAIPPQAGLAPNAPTTLPDAGMLSANPQAAYQGGGLGTPQPAQTPQAPAPQEDISPRQQIVKDMFTGNLANDPDKLNAIAAAAAMNGMGKSITPWLEGIYKLKKSGVFDGAMSLINNDVDGAMASLKQGGINLEDRPVKVKPDDPNDHQWKLNVSGTGERVMDVKNMIGSTMEPDKFLKWQNDFQESNAKVQESNAKVNVSDSQVRENDSRVRVSNAQAGKLGEDTKTIRADRNDKTSGLGDIVKLPAPAATAEWLVRKGVYDNYKDAFNAVKTLNDKSPAAQRQALVDASMKNGLSLSEASNEVDAFMKSSDKKTGTETPGKTRKYNPKTGGFD